MPLEDVVALYTSLVNLALKCYPTRIDYVDKVLGCIVDISAKRDAAPYGSREGEGSRADSSSASKELLRLMKVPVRTYDETLTILKLDNFPRVFDLFDFHGRKNLANFIAQTIVDKEALVPTADEV